MSQLGVFARLVAKPGERDQLASALQALINGVGSEEGTLQYLLHADSADADVLWFYERYTGDDALKVHQSADYAKAAGPDIGAHLAGRPELHFTTLLGGKGAD